MAAHERGDWQKTGAEAIHYDIARMGLYLHRKRTGPGIRCL